MCDSPWAIPPAQQSFGRRRSGALACLYSAILVLTGFAVAAEPPHDFAAATRGDRASGWLPQSRSEVLARNGIVTTSQPLAAQAGLQILKKGGNAFDAAVATAAVLNVVEPGSAGLGGDVFVIAWDAKEKKLIALNGSGRAPSGATRDHIATRAKDSKMPEHGIDSATVPGAVDAWDALLERAGTMTFNRRIRDSDPAPFWSCRRGASAPRSASSW